MLAVLPLALLLAGLLAIPLVELTALSLRGESGVSLEHYRNIFLSPTLRAALFTSVTLSAAVALISTVLCLAPAWLFARHEFLGKRLLRAVFALPMALSGIIVGFLVVVTLGNAGLVPQLAEKHLGAVWLSGVAYTLSGVIVAYLYFEIPRATLTLEAALAEFDTSLLDAARTLGASRAQRLRYVLLPALKPALRETLALTFSASLGSFGVMLILSTRGVSVLPLEAFTALFGFPSDAPGAAAMAMVLLVIALALPRALRIRGLSWRARY